jgi:iron complex transport system substrate-binding protein
MKKIVTIIVALSLVCGLTACSKDAPDTAQTEVAGTMKAEQEAADKSVQESGEKTVNGTRTVVDHGGIKVELPEKIEKVVITSPWPLPSVYAIFWGSAENIVGVHPAAKSGSREFIWEKAAPEMLDVETAFLEGETMNTEELMALDPDVVFYMAGDEGTLDTLNQLGIPGVGFSVSKWEFNAIETANGWMELLNEIFPEQDDNKEYIEYGRAVEQMVLNKTKDIAEDDKPKVLFIRECNTGSIATYGSAQFAQYWTDTTGSINVGGSEALPGYEITMEQIYEWDPDIIFITDFTKTMPEDLYQNHFEGQDWSGITAVKEQKVYKLPNGLFRWYPASAEAPLALQWYAVHVHPELFADIDMDQEIKDYYKEFFDVTLTDEDVVEIYNTPAEVAEGAQ